MIFMQVFCAFLEKKESHKWGIRLVLCLLNIKNAVAAVQLF